MVTRATHATALFALGISGCFLPEVPTLAQLGGADADAVDASDGSADGATDAGRDVPINVNDSGTGFCMLGGEYPSPMTLALGPGATTGATSGHNVSGSGSCHSGYVTFPVALYQLVVPTREGVRVTISGLSDDFLLDVRGPCRGEYPSETGCLTLDSTLTSRTASRVLEGGTYSVAVYARAGEPFQLETMTFVPPDNANCNQALHLALGQTLTDIQDLGTGSAGPTCVGPSSQMLYYTATPDGTHPLAVTVTPHGPTAWAPTVVFMSDCAYTLGTFGTCLTAGQTAPTPGVPFTATYNTSSTAPVIIGVGSQGPAPYGATFSLGVASGP